MSYPLILKRLSNDFNKMPTIIVKDNMFVLGCVEGDVRLIGGANYMEGHVEICFNNEWGTVCNQMWDVVDAGVVCRQLGLTLSGIYLL